MSLIAGSPEELPCFKKSGYDPDDTRAFYVHLKTVKWYVGTKRYIACLLQCEEKTACDDCENENENKKNIFDLLLSSYRGFGGIQGSSRQQINYRIFDMILLLNNAIQQINTNAVDGSGIDSYAPILTRTPLNRL